MSIVLPPISTLEWPSRAVKITRNMSGNANVKNAEAGFRQNALFTYRNWTPVSRRAVIAGLRCRR